MERNMITEGTQREWNITISLDSIESYVNSMAIRRYANTDIEHKNENVLYTDKDRDLLMTMIAPAVSDIQNILARRMESPAVIEDGKIKFVLIVGDNHDDAMANVLYMRIVNYLQQFAYFVWINEPFSQKDDILREIRSAIHYRKHSVAKYRKDGIF